MFFSFRSSAWLALAAPLLAQAQETPAPSAAAPKVDANIITLGRYEVVADKYDPHSTEVLTSVTVIGFDQLQAETVDYPLEVFGKVPGITLTDFNQGIITAEISMRGFNGEGGNQHMRLLVDGIPHNLNSGFNDLGAIFPLEMERIEAIKGPADARYGLNAVAGTVHVQTQRLYEGLKLKARAGSFGVQEGQLLGGFRKGGFNQTYFAGYRKSDGYRDHSSLEKYSLAGKWFFTGRDERWRLGLSLRQHEFKADAPGYLPLSLARLTPTASPSFSSTDGGEQNNQQASLHLDLRPAEGLTIATKAYRHEVERNRFVRFTAAGAQQERLEDELHSGVSTHAHWAFDAAPWRPKVHAGVEYHRQDADNQRYATIERRRTSTTRNHNYLLKNTGGFLGTEFAPVSAWRVDGALRFDTFSGEMTNRVNGAKIPIIDYGTIWQPKLSTSYLWTKNLQTYASYGRSFQIGAGSAAYSTRPLEASKNDGYEVGVLTTPRQDLTVRLAVWRQTATDEVKVKADGSGDSENVGETRRQGADLEVTWRARKDLAFWTSYTLHEGEFINPGLRPADVALKGKKIDHIPEYAVRVGADWDVTSQWTASVSSQGQGGYYLTPDNATGRFGDQWLVDLDLRYRWQHYTLGVTVKNALDRYYEYVWHDGTQSLHSAGDGRAFYTTLTWDF